MISTIISILVFFSCWIQDDVAFYVSVVSYAVLIFLFNIVVKIDIFFIDKIRSLYYVTFIYYLSIHSSLSIIYLSVRPSVSPHTFLQTSLLSFLTLCTFPCRFLWWFWSRSVTCEPTVLQELAVDWYRTWRAWPVLPCCSDSPGLLGSSPGVQPEWFYCTGSLHSTPSKVKSSSIVLPKVQISGVENEQSLNSKISNNFKQIQYNQVCFWAFFYLLIIQLQITSTNTELLKINLPC